MRSFYDSCLVITLLPIGGKVHFSTGVGWHLSHLHSSGGVMGFGGKLGCIGADCMASISPLTPLL